MQPLADHAVAESTNWEFAIELPEPPVEIDPFNVKTASLNNLYLSSLELVPVVVKHLILN